MLYCKISDISSASARGTFHLPRAVQSTTKITAKKFFSRETRNVSTGKLEVWRAEEVETARSTVSSFVKISGGSCSGGIGQIKHFADLKVAEKTQS